MYNLNKDIFLAKILLRVSLLNLKKKEICYDIQYSRELGL